MRPEGINPIEDGLQDLNRKLDAQREERKENRLEKSIAAIIGNAKDMSVPILSAMSNGQNWRQQVVYIVETEIVRAIDGNLAVPFFSQSAKAAQTVYLYIGTHWVVLGQQQYYDFISDCAAKIGLGNMQLCDTGFMMKLCENVAYMISRHREPNIPSGQACVNLQNGTLEIDKNGNLKFRPHSRDDFFNYCLGYDYVPQAECPLWHKFLDEVLPEPESQAVLGEYTAYSFTRDIKIEKMLVLYGLGANGKSVVLATLASLYGSENVSSVSLSDITNDPTRRLLIENKLANISYESGRALNADALKTLVSGEPILVKSLYHDVRNMTRYAKLFTSFNELPTAENTFGYFRRWLLMPFTVTIPEDKADVDLPKKLEAELPGILNWVLGHLQNFLRNRAFTKSPACEKALYNYKMSSDSVKLFFIERCETTKACETQGKELYNEYKSSAYNDGMKPVGKQKFFDRLAAIEGVERIISNKIPKFNIKLTNNG